MKNLLSKIFVICIIVNTSILVNAQNISFKMLDAKQSDTDMSYPEKFEYNGQELNLRRVGDLIFYESARKLKLDYYYLIQNIYDENDKLKETIEIFNIMAKKSKNSENAPTIRAFTYRRDQAVVTASPNNEFFVTNYKQYMDKNSNYFVDIYNKQGKKIKTEKYSSTDIADYDLIDIIVTNNAEVYFLSEMFDKPESYTIIQVRNDQLRYFDVPVKDAYILLEPSLVANESGEICLIGLYAEDITKEYLAKGVILSKLINGSFQSSYNKFDEEKYRISKNSTLTNFSLSSQGDYISTIDNFDSMDAFVGGLSSTVEQGAYSVTTIRESSLSTAIGKTIGIIGVNNAGVLKFVTSIERQYTSNVGYMYSYFIEDDGIYVFYNDRKIQEVDGCYVAKIDFSGNIIYQELIISDKQSKMVLMPQFTKKIDDYQYALYFSELKIGKDPILGIVSVK